VVLSLFRFMRLTDETSVFSLIVYTPPLFYTDEFLGDPNPIVQHVFQSPMLRSPTLKGIFRGKTPLPFFLLIDRWRACLAILSLSSLLPFFPGKIGFFQFGSVRDSPGLGSSTMLDSSPPFFFGPESVPFPEFGEK